MNCRISLVVCLCLLLIASFSFGQDRRNADKQNGIEQIDVEPIDSKRDRVVPVRIYLNKEIAPQPIVLFSHGLGGSRNGNTYVGNHWAAAGYVVVFMQHHGSDTDVMKNAPLAQRFQKLKRAANLTSTKDRLGDVSYVIDQLERWNQETGHPLHNRLNLQKIGMSGHSFGAVTTLGMAGRKYPLGLMVNEPRLDAFLAFSPQPGQGKSPSDSTDQH